MVTIFDFFESQQIKSKIRHSGYYNLIDTFDKLYYESINNKLFYNLMNLIISDDNILLAYRNIKKKGDFSFGFSLYKGKEKCIKLVLK